MNENLDTLAAAWRRAADLGLNVTAPFDLADGSASCIAWVADFGSTRGTVVAGRRSASKDIRAFATSGAMYCSEVDEEAYSRYDRELFVETLTDWGWFGDPTTLPES